MVGVPATGVARAGETTLAGVLPPEGTPIGKISVLSSRFFFGFGSGAVRRPVSRLHQHIREKTTELGLPLSFSCT